MQCLTYVHIHVFPKEGKIMPLVRIDVRKGKDARVTSESYENKFIGN